MKSPLTLLTENSHIQLSKFINANKYKNKYNTKSRITGPHSSEANFFLVYLLTELMNHHQVTPQPGGRNAWDVGAASASSKPHEDEKPHLFYSHRHGQL